MKAAVSPRILRLPSSGHLLVCTDLHGNLLDFTRMKDIFLRSKEGGEDPFLLFTGDLVHGPNWKKEDWPDYLGAFFEDESSQLVEEYIALKERFPDRVACLLGNHEHSHIGGPHTPKFWADETLFFERSVGPERTARYQALFRSFPVLALSRSGVVVTHAAPNIGIKGPWEIESLDYEGFEDFDINSMFEHNVLGSLLWSRGCQPVVARQFLNALSKGGPPLSLVVYGHDIVYEGFDLIGEEQVILSTSFGVREENKYYLKLDLARRYQGVSEFEVGRELLKLVEGANSQPLTAPRPEESTVNR